MQKRLVLHCFCVRRSLAGPMLLSTVFALGACFAVRAQAPPASQAASALPDAPLPQAAVSAPSPSDEVRIRDTPRNILGDQAAIWTSPIRLRAHDLGWLVPLTLATGAAIATDHRAMTQVVSRDPSFNNTSINVSNGLVGAWVAAPFVVYGAGRIGHNGQAREAGILSAESMADGVVVEQGIKLMFWRERPNVDKGRGRFFQSSAGVDSSFFSAHSTIAWACASALAAESSSHWTQFALYTGAAGVSLTRVLGQEHFPSDVLVGSAAGWLIGHYVVRRHRHSTAKLASHHEGGF
jgi:membrane-associated phospholipid phosphatase